MTTPTLTARRLLTALLGGGAILLTACQPGNAADPRPSATVSSATTPSASPPTRTATSPGLTAQQRLTVLAETVKSTPADNTSDLPYTYLHLQTWARATNTIVRTDLQRWRHTADSSGTEITRRAPDLPGVDHRPTRQERRLFDQATPTTTHYPAGELHAYLPGAVPTDAAALAQLLAPPELADEPAYPRLLASGVVGLATSHHLDQQQRAATLHVLATIPGITYHGTMTDLAGRTGLTFRVEAEGSTSTLIIDPATGQLLAAHETVAGIKPGLFSYVLILARGHTSGDNVTPATTGTIR
ncbi:hypothetical protein [Verrucosispora sp. WMMC514]|uniref:hypothetical protein n=1 Tax=Verrucosispora sp. WMMC514 TaxID=3015156 RepID=UPI00248C3648|nr:hypothetical protein [Verrucosispora sp. WMMC514]WBB93361.1 hypothetical protein O7597_10485 [Verrucosispora sp. WMMC514]